MKDLHIDLLMGDTPAENVHLDLWDRHVTFADCLNFVTDFVWFSRVVSLKVVLEVITTEDLNLRSGNFQQVVVCWICCVLGIDTPS